MGYLIDVTINDDGSVTKEKMGGTLEDASAVKMADGSTVQKNVTDLQNRDNNIFGTDDHWKGGSYVKGQLTIDENTCFECKVNNNNVKPTTDVGSGKEGTYWKKVSLSELSNEISNLSNVEYGSFVSNNYSVEYHCQGKICQVRVYLNSSVSSNVDVSLSTRLPYKPKIKMAVSAYSCKNGSFIEISTAGGIRVYHQVGDGWFQACATFITD